MSKIKNVVFDFGGVLIDWNPRYMYRNVFSEEEEMEHFLKNICTDQWNAQQDKGRLLAEATLLLQMEFPDKSDLIQLYYDKWEEMLNGSIQENVEVLEELHGNYPLYGLTNWSAETFPIALERFGFLRYFNEIVVSGEEKMIKPDKEIFDLMLNRYSLKAEECIFIDDNEKNIKTATEMGFKVVHFTEGVNLRNELKIYNLLS